MPLTDAEFYLLLGLQYSQDENNKQAIDFFSTALEIDPYLTEAYGFRGMAHLQLENYQAALDDFNNALALEPELENVYFYRALYFYKMKLYDQAIKDLTSAIEIDKHFGDAYLYRGFCKGMVDDLQGATFDIQAAAQLGIPEAQKTLNERGIPW